VIRERPTRGLLVADVPYDTVGTISPPTLWATTTVPVRWSPPSLRGYPPGSPTPRQRYTALVAGRTSGALRRRLLVVDVAVTLVLVAAAQRRRSCPRRIFGSFLATHWRHRAVECRQHVAQGG